MNDFRGRASTQVVRDVKDLLENNMSIPIDHRPALADPRHEFIRSSRGRRVIAWAIASLGSLEPDNSDTSVSSPLLSLSLPMQQSIDTCHCALGGDDGC
jgi:hypothetical protein